MSEPVRKSTDPLPLVHSFADLVGMLNFVDEMHDRCAEIRDTLWRRNFVFLALFSSAVVLTSFSCWLPDANGAGHFKIAGAALSIGFGLFLMGVLLPARRRTTRELARNQRTLDQLVDVLRAIEPFIARESNLSFVEHSTFRIRIARFDIGPEAVPPRAPADPKTFVPIVSSPVSFRELREAEQPTHS